MHWMLMPFRRYVDFKGRSQRMEFWMFCLLNLLVMAFTLIPALLLGDFSAVPAAPDGEIGRAEAAALPLIKSGGTFSAILAGCYVLYFIAAFVPSLAVAVRRFHDQGMTGWWVLGFAFLQALPFIGMIATGAYIYFLASNGTAGPNKYGDDPKGLDGPGIFV